MQATDLSSSMESLTYETSSLSSPTNSSSTVGTIGGGAMSQQQQQQQTRTKRMRTSFKHHQLRTMKSYFNINQNPDAKDLKQLAQKTGLSKRVLQVSGPGRFRSRFGRGVLLCWTRSRSDPTIRTVRRKTNKFSF
jgi:LIM homeobox protein 2/9